MRFFNKLILTCFIAGCTTRDPGKAGEVVAPAKKADTVSNVAAPVRDSISTGKDDTALINISAAVLKSIKAKDARQLASFIQPDSAIRFSPYGNIDTLHDQLLSARQLTGLGGSQKILKWGSADGTGKPIILSFDKYLQSVYDADFLNAKRIAVNKITGNPTNLKEIYPGCDFTEFYFPGNPKYDGMDWKAIRLVFKKEEGKYFLKAIIHDQWTT